MKKIMVGILIFAMLICFAGCGGAKGENITGITTTDNMVYFEPKCPECKHISRTKSLNLCEGEDYNGMYQCEECGEIYDISIER
jgi:hypothetical protein